MLLKQLILYTPLLFCCCLSNYVYSSVPTETENPFTPRGYVLRYWNKEIRNTLPKPDFLISKASPLTATQSAVFSKLADQNALGTKLPDFCSSAKLLCFPDVSSSLEKHVKDVNFATYSSKNFTNYGTTRHGGADQFKKYSEDTNVDLDTFRRYSRGSVGHDDKFTLYSTDSNVVESDFNTYGTGTVGGAGDFSKYAGGISNVPDLKFTSYSAGASGREQKFTTYAESGNAGGGTFTSYGKNNKIAKNEFKSYGHDTNVFGSNFNTYSETSTLGNDTFTSYGDGGNNPDANFKSYLDGARDGYETFTSYRNESNVGDDTFQSYAKNADVGTLKFSNYGKSFNQGTDKFTGYGQGVQTGLTADFKIYGVNTTFKDYTKEKEGVTFSQYSNGSTSSSSKTTSLDDKSIKRWVEPGKFFHESQLKTGVVMPMPDIRDKMPKRSFLPRSISSKLPFATSKLEEMKKIFHAAGKSTMETMLKDGVTECERAPSVGETKRCVSSMEDMIDFAVSVLGRNVAVRSTANVNGSKGDILIGSVSKVNGGKVTKSVSCHQSLFPYLLYYCHSVPKVRVYEADILDPSTKATINHGVAICHLDTSAWGKSHGAFIALGSAPGKTEVCHWIFENDVTWAIAD